MYSFNAQGGSLIQKTFGKPEQTHPDYQWDAGNKPVTRKEDVISRFEREVSDISSRRTMKKKR